MLKSFEFTNKDASPTRHKLKQTGNIHVGPSHSLLFVCTLKVHKKFLANNKFTKEAIPSVKIPHAIQNLKNSVSKVRNWDKLCTLIFDEMSIMLHVGYDHRISWFRDGQKANTGWPPTLGGTSRVN
jgi:hypothetical protein